MYGEEMLKFGIFEMGVCLNSGYAPRGGKKGAVAARVPAEVRQGDEHLSGRGNEFCKDRDAKVKMLKF